MTQVNLAHRSQCNYCEKVTQGISGDPKWCCYCGAKLETSVLYGYTFPSMLESIRTIEYSEVEERKTYFVSIKSAATDVRLMQVTQKFDKVVCLSAKGDFVSNLQTFFKTEDVDFIEEYKE